MGLTFDLAGNLYVADTGHSRVRKISTSGIITAVAGNGIRGSAGDGGGQATSAALMEPVAIAFDSATNLYVVDPAAHVVRQVSPTGIITTFAGNGNTTPMGEGGPAISAGLVNPCGVVADSAGNVYIADGLTVIFHGYPIAPRLRKVSGGIITTIAGTGVADYTGDGYRAILAQITLVNVAIDHQGNLTAVEDVGVRTISPGTDGKPWIVTTTGIYHRPGFSGGGGPTLFAQ